MHRLRSGEAQARFHAGKCVGRQACALFQRQPDFVVPVDVIGCEGDQLGRVGGFRAEQYIDGMRRRRVGTKAVGQPRAPAGHRIRTRVHRRQGNARFVRASVGQCLHVAAVGRKRQLEQRTCKTRTAIDQGEQRARGDVEPRQRAPPKADGLAHQPVRRICAEDGVDRQHDRWIALRAQNPHADVEFVGAQEQDCIVEFACRRERPPGRARGDDGLGRVGARLGRRAQGQRGDPRRPVQFDAQVRVTPASVLLHALQRSQFDAGGAGRTIAAMRELLRTLPDRVREVLGLGAVIDEAPSQRAIGAHALDRGAENVGQIATDTALVGQPRQATGARQHREQRHFGQAHRRAAIVDHSDLVAREREFIAASRRRTVERRQRLQPRVTAGILDAVARLVGELAEIDLPRVRRQPEHVDVGARAEHALLAAGQNDAAHAGVLEAQALQRIRKFDVDAEIVGIELEPVAGPDAALLGDVERERRRLAIDRELPMHVTVGMRIEGHHWQCLAGSTPAGSGSIRRHSNGEYRIVHDRWRSTSRSSWEP